MLVVSPISRDDQDSDNFRSTAIVVFHRQRHRVRSRNRECMLLRVHSGELECPARNDVRIQSDITIEVSHWGWEKTKDKKVNLEDVQDIGEMTYIGLQPEEIKILCEVGQQNEYISKLY